MNFRSLKLLGTIVAGLSFGIFSSCDEDDPKKEDTPELITEVRLTFSPSAGGSAIVVTATDPDGVGLQNIAPDGPINLEAFKSYTLTIELINGLANPSDPAYNITEEVEEESDEHMLFFSWTNNVFADPAGDGNIDNRSDVINYEDEDVNGLPLGLKTLWTTGTASSGKFFVILKHQPDLKSTSSTSSMGETDLDLEFTINIQ